MAGGRHHGPRLLRQRHRCPGWAVISDAAPKEIAGLSGALFNMFSNISSITTPIVIGYILHATGSFDGALVFIGAVAILSYVVVVGEIKRLELQPLSG
jgi:MFS transporter, ACS family, glucarate transporter